MAKELSWGRIPPEQQKILTLLSDGKRRSKDTIRREGHFKNRPASSLRALIDAGLIDEDRRLEPWGLGITPQALRLMGKPASLYPRIREDADE